jgi:hypothetical protein
MLTLVTISEVGDPHVSAGTKAGEAQADPSDISSFQAALSKHDETSDAWSAGVFELVGTAAKGFREDRQHVDAAWKTAVDTLDPWEMGKAVVAMSEYNHATQLATKLLNHATQSIDQLARGS